MTTTAVFLRRVASLSVSALALCAWCCTGGDDGDKDGRKNDSVSTTNATQPDASLEGQSETGGQTSPGPEAGPGASSTSDASTVDLDSGEPVFSDGSTGPNSFPDVCYRECDTIAAVCSWGADPYAETRASVMGRCAPDRRYAAHAGRCSGGRSFLRESSGAGVTAWIYDTSGTFLGLIATHDATDHPCVFYYWPDPVKCEDAVVDEVFCGDERHVGDEVPFPTWEE